MNTFKQKTGGMLFCLLEALVGILLLINPVGFTSGILTSIGAILAVAGLITVIRYFRTPIEFAASEQYLMKGLLCILIGCFGLFGTGWLVGIVSLSIPMIYGVIILITGLAKLQTAADTLRRREKRWFLGLLSAAITLICAGVILLNPFTTTAVLWMFTGISMLVDALFDILALLFGKGKQA